MSSTASPTTDALPIIEIRQLHKTHLGPHPLRIEALVVRPVDRLVLSGLDGPDAETFIHLVTGAALPDSGDVSVAGRNTRDIATDTEWLTSLDQFGLVSERAVLLDSLSVAANLAMPLTLSIDPMSPDVRTRVAGLADEVGLAPDCLDAPAGGLQPDERVRLHLARAIAPGPAFILLEHPTSTLDTPDRSRRLGEALRRVGQSRAVGWLALSDDRAFARATAGAVRQLDRTTGRLRRRWWGRRPWGGR